MGIFHLTEKEFNSVIKNSLRLFGCPKCKRAPILSVELKVYGAELVGFKCPHCEYEITVNNKHDIITSETKFGTPITPMSLATTIFSAAEKWNNSVKGI